MMDDDRIRPTTAADEHAVEDSLSFEALQISLVGGNIEVKTSSVFVVSSNKAAAPKRRLLTSSLVFERIKLV